MNKLQLLSAVTLSIVSLNAAEQPLEKDSFWEDFVIVHNDAVPKESGAEEVNLQDLINQRITREDSLIEEATDRSNKKSKPSLATEPSLATACYVENYLSDDDEEIRLKKIEKIPASPINQIHEVYNYQVDGYFSKKGSDQTNGPHPTNDAPLTEPLKQPNRRGISNLIAQLFHFSEEHHSATTQPRVEPQAQRLQKETAQQSEIKLQPEGLQDLSSSIMSSSIMESVIPQEHQQDLSSSMRASSTMEVSQLLQVTQSEQSQDLSLCMTSTSIIMETIPPLQTTQPPLVQKESEPMTTQQLQLTAEAAIEAQPQLQHKPLTSIETTQHLQVIQPSQGEVKAKETTARKPQPVLTQQHSQQTIQKARRETQPSTIMPPQIATHPPLLPAVKQLQIPTKQPKSKAIQSAHRGAPQQLQAVISTQRATQPAPSSLRTRIVQEKKGKLSTVSSSTVVSHQTPPVAQQSQMITQFSSSQSLSQSNRTPEVSKTRPPLRILHVKPIRIIPTPTTTLGDMPYAVKVPQ